jgi:hypothetical protein
VEAVQLEVKPCWGGGDGKRVRMLEVCCAASNHRARSLSLPRSLALSLPVQT